ncbi:WD repeat domain phosphoinositide-interacting protein 1 [Dissostichus eleginoides]|uniref:WD repeat domain phosphoinositide-interacting protein 1 n=1 Tax=Dissostichus eleginoides TaxID=100907 RepID=A0AAD9CIK6_DISEL|nr:WD repeat domain phosphoinositide-interacting protein 1 [Dissostichus eleginoides]
MTSSLLPPPPPPPLLMQPPGVFTNGLLDLDPPTKVNPHLPPDVGAAFTPALPPRNNASTMGKPPASEDGAKLRGLLTTEL